MNIPTVDEIDRIARHDDVIVRNLEITQCYYEISQSVTELLGPAANWCTFATWASKQAGQTIRQEDLLRAFEERFNLSSEVSARLAAISSRLMSMGARLHGKLSRATLLEALDPAAAFARAADAVARGNKKVFEEIGREFARFLVVCGPDTLFDRNKTANFCATLSAGDPPDGQRLLGDAFMAYGEARFTSGKARAELILLGNLCAGFHEQTRLQPEIAEALNAALGGVEDLKRNLLARLFPAMQRNSYVGALLRQATDLDRVLVGLIEVVNRLSRQVITDHLMTLHLSSNEVLRLGRDLSNQFSAELAQIANPRLKEMLARVDLSPDSLRGSGAVDWANFPDRMHFIADFFRVYQVREQLFAPAFTTEQVVLIKSGKRPVGPL
jgi:hypothetical protein